MSDNQQQQGGVLAQVINAIDKESKEALKKELRGKVTAYRSAKAAADAILADIVDTLTEAGHGDESTVRELLAV